MPTLESLQTEVDDLRNAVGVTDSHVMEVRTTLAKHTEILKRRHMGVEPDES